MQYPSEAIALIILIAFQPIYLHCHPTIRVRESERAFECHGCMNQCDMCEYGVTISSQCGVLQCRKGPDEHCGGHDKGVCGDGMKCLCERCIGCSVDTLECSNPDVDHPCLPPHHGTNHESIYYKNYNHHNEFLI